MELKSISLEDREEMLDILTNPLVSETYMLPDFASREDALPLFHRLVELSQKRGRFVRGMYVGGRLVGFLNDVEIESSRIELGYVVHPGHWAKGYATAALRLAIAECFANGFREVITGAFEENTASIRCMEKAGMQKLPKTDEIEYRGRTHRCVYYSKTR